MSEDYFRLLRRMPVFGGLKNETLQLILEYSPEIDVEAGEYFFHEGDRAESAFVLLRGCVVIERLWEGAPIVLCRLGRGDCIGEMSLIDLMPRSASVRAEDDCQALEVKLRALHRLYKQEAEQYAALMMNMGREVSRRLRLADDRLFALEQEIPRCKEWNHYST